MAIRRNVFRRNGIRDIPANFFFPANTVKPLTDKSGGKTKYRNTWKLILMPFILLFKTSLNDIIMSLVDILGPMIYMFVILKFKMDVKLRYTRKVSKYCGGLDPYLHRDLFSSLALPTHLEDDDIKYYFMRRESTYSLKEFAASKSLGAIKFYEAGWVLSIRGKKIGKDFVVLGKVNKIFIPIMQLQNNTLTSI